MTLKKSACRGGEVPVIFWYQCGRVIEMGTPPQPESEGGEDPHIVNQGVSFMHNCICIICMCNVHGGSTIPYMQM